jgi:hypothetical protein|nr:MAG TPA: DNA gyrase subunit A [Caudoviricetes sp.]
MKEKLFCKICGKELQGSQRLYCSSSCKQKGHYQDIKNNTNTSHSQYIGTTIEYGISKIKLLNGTLTLKQIW